MKPSQNENNFIIDTTQINEIITPQLTTYTFGVIEQNPIEGFRNVVIKISSNETTIYLIHFLDEELNPENPSRVIVSEMEDSIFDKGSTSPACFALDYQCRACGSKTCDYAPGWVLVSIPCEGSGGGGSGNDDGGGWPEPDPYDPHNGGDAPIGPIGGGYGGGTPNNTMTTYINNLLEENPFLLLDIPCNQIHAWQAVAQHQVPQSVIDKLENIDENQTDVYYDWDIQSIEDANGAAVNMDYFSVTMNQMPSKPYPNQNQRFTPEEFLYYVRTNLNSFVNTSYSSFSPSTVTGYNESAIWFSNDPTNAIIHINIPGNDGSVICSGFEVNNNIFSGQFNYANWFFTTLETPWAYFTLGYDGPHPVSGNRQFGLIKNPNNGTYTFYTRGVDRFEGYLGIERINGVQEIAFEKADELWKSFQQGIKNYVNTHNANATVNTPVTWRPNWNKVKNVLNGTRPISDLGCN